MNKISPLTTVAELDQVTRQLKQQNQKIGVVPTMGALHEGHLSLVRQSLKQADETIVTIFVNPTQFAPSEDLEKYPRTLDEDLEQLTNLGVRRVFLPSVETMYPGGWSTQVMPPAVSMKLEGEYRPQHFGGVATVVLKLLNMTRAEIAFFGQKDFQQSIVIKQMVADLNVPVEIQVCPIVRDPDGLALSSRNRYLTADQREVGLVLNRTLEHVAALIEDGLTDGFEIVTEMRQMLIDGGVTSVDYAVVADPETLETAAEVTGPVVALIAAYVGQTRLIDNRLIG